MVNLGVEKEIRLLALPVADDAACPTLDHQTAVALTRSYLRRLGHETQEPDEVIWRMWEAARAIAFSPLNINATILELVLEALERAGKPATSSP